MEPGGRQSQCSARKHEKVQTGSQIQGRDGSRSYGKRDVKGVLPESGRKGIDPAPKSSDCEWAHHIVLDRFSVSETRRAHGQGTGFGRVEVRCIGIVS